MAGNLTNVLKLYTSVMDDVISGVREVFLDDGIDEQVLVELRQNWESKLLASKVTTALPDLEPQPASQMKNEIVTSNLETNDIATIHNATNSQQSQNTIHMQLPTKQPVPVNPTENSSPVLSTINDINTKLVPVQLSIPTPNSTTPRIFSIQIPASALVGNHLQQVLSSSVIAAALALPSNLGSTLIQQHIMSAIQGQSTSSPAALSNGCEPNMPSQITTNGNPLLQPRNISQLDGQLYTSDDDDNDDDDDEDDDDDDDLDDDDDEEDDDDDDENDIEDKDDDNDMETTVDEDPLNTDDDVSEGDGKELFDSENVIVCQYDKVTRSRNKWKFYMKDGIMNLNGRDFVFQRASGDAEW